MLCHIVQGSVHLLSVLNNISSIPLGEESGSLLSFHLYVAQQVTTPLAASIYHQRNSIYFSDNPSQSLSPHVTECCEGSILCFWIWENCKCCFMVEAPEFLFRIAVPSPAKPSSFASRNGRDSCKEQFSENTMGLWGMLLGFSDAFSVELFYQIGGRLRYMQIQKIFRSQGWKEVLHCNSRLQRGQGSLVPHLWDLLFVKS